MKYILIFLLPALHLTASDISVTTVPAVFGNDGAMQIQIDPSITDYPLQLTITNPGNTVHSAVMTTSTYDYTNLAPGHYTIQIETANGCTSMLGVNILECRQQGESYSCLYPKSPGPLGGLFLIANPTNILNEVEEAEELLYELYYNPDDTSVYTSFSGIFAKVHNLGIGFVKEIIQYGSTIHDVTFQDEINNDAPYIMKFDSTGQIVWIYHNRIVEERASDVALHNKDCDLGTTISVAPNPTQSSCMISFCLNQPATVQLKIVGVNGVKIKDIRFQAIEGTNKYILNDLENIADGTYIIQIISDRILVGSDYLFIHH